MDNVIDFKPRGRAPEPPSELPTPTAPEVAQMLNQSAAMTLIATLAFYAGQGWDGGKQARDAHLALGRLLALKNVPLPFLPDEGIGGA